MSLVAIVGRDLIIASRISAAAEVAGHDVVRVDQPADLPPAPDVNVAFVDWGARQPAWAGVLADWLHSSPVQKAPRLVVFGPHTDLAAHAEARAAGIGPMLARSKLVSDLPRMLEGAQAARSCTRIRTAPICTEGSQTTLTRPVPED